MHLNLSAIGDYWASLGGTDVQTSQRKLSWSTEMPNPNCAGKENEILRACLETCE